MDSEMRELMDAVLARLRVAEAERKADRDRLDLIIGRLDEHGAILADHSAILAKHSAKLDRLNATVDEHSVKLDRMNATVDEHSVKLDTLAVGMDGLRKQVSRLSARDLYFAEKLGRHDMDIADLKKQLGTE